MFKKEITKISDGHSSEKSVEEKISSMYDEMGIRFNEICTKFYMRKAKMFADACGIYPTNLSGIMNGRSKPTVDVYRVLLTMPQIDARWLLFGEGDMLVRDCVNIVGDASINAPNNLGEQHNTIGCGASDKATIDELRRQLEDKDKQLVEKDKMLDVKDQQIKDLTANMQTISDALLKMITSNTTNGK